MPKNYYGEDDPEISCPIEGNRDFSIVTNQDSNNRHRPYRNGPNARENNPSDDPYSI